MASPYHLSTELLDQRSTVLPDSHQSLPETRPASAQELQLLRDAGVLESYVTSATLARLETAVDCVLRGRRVLAGVVQQLLRCGRPEKAVAGSRNPTR